MAIVDGMELFWSRYDGERWKRNAYDRLPPLPRQTSNLNSLSWQVTSVHNSSPLTHFTDLFHITRQGKKRGSPIIHRSRRHHHIASPPAVWYQCHHILQSTPLSFLSRFISFFSILSSFFTCGRGNSEQMGNFRRSSVCWWWCWGCSTASIPIYPQKNIHIFSPSSLLPNNPYNHTKTCTLLCISLVF